MVRMQLYMKLHDLSIDKIDLESFQIVFVVGISKQQTTTSHHLSPFEESHTLAKINAIKGKNEINNDCLESIVRQQMLDSIGYERKNDKHYCPIENRH